MNTDALKASVSVPESAGDNQSPTARSKRVPGPSAAQGEPWAVESAEPSLAFGDPATLKPSAKFQKMRVSLLDQL